MKALSDLLFGTTSAFTTGGGLTTGIATLDFGTGEDLASVAVTGQTGITINSVINVLLMDDSTTDNDSVAHIMAAGLIRLVAGNIIAGTGFTVYGICYERALTGTIKVRWSY